MGSIKSKMQKPGKQKHCIELILPFITHPGQDYKTLFQWQAFIYIFLFAEKPATIATFIFLFRKIYYHK